MPLPRLPGATLLAGALALVAATAALADAGRRMPAGTPPAYRDECGSCHVPYPPGLLPARSWARLMDGLGRHYGSDASLDEATLRRLSQWLQAEAGTGRRVGEPPPEDRLTRAAWFERRHRRIDPSVWTLASVGRASNCGACHPGAARGEYDDDRLTVPTGVAPALRRAWHD